MHRFVQYMLLRNKSWNTNKIQITRLLSTTLHYSRVASRVATTSCGEDGTVMQSKNIPPRLRKDVAWKHPQLWRETISISYTFHGSLFTNYYYYYYESILLPTVLHTILRMSVFLVRLPLLSCCATQVSSRNFAKR